MKVFELIRELAAFDPNMEVSITDGLNPKGELIYRGAFDVIECDDWADGGTTVDIGIGGCNHHEQSDEAIETEDIVDLIRVKDGYLTQEQLGKIQSILLG